MNVLVTGASGLLGSRMMIGLPQKWEISGTYASRSVFGLFQLNIADAASVERMVVDGGYDWVVHCAAIRSPDECKHQRHKATLVNVEGTANVCRAALAAGARVAYASTDYVFSGESPPYAETDVPNPLNIYGQTKLEGEKHVLAVPGSLVVRMPALYSLDLEAPGNVLADLRDALHRREAVAADDRAVRYYTLAEEVAAAFGYLMTEGVEGVVHVSAEEASSKLEFLHAAGAAMGLDTSLLQPAGPDSARAARPHDSHLDTSRYRSLGGPEFTGYGAALARLAPLVD